MALLPLPSEVDFGKLQVETSLIFMASARICHRRPKMGSSTFLVGSVCQLLLGREVQAAQPEEDHRPEIGDAPEAPCSAADRLDDGVQPFQERVCGAPLPPVQDALPLLPERPRHVSRSRAASELAEMFARADGETEALPDKGPDAAARSALEFLRRLTESLGLVE